jgi:hypothetical protein
MEATTFRQENTTIFSFFAWMKNLDLLPLSKEVTFFLERAGRSSGRDGLLSIDAPLTAPLEGRDAMLLIHLDHYYDWTTLPLSSASSEVSGFPPHLALQRVILSRCSAALLGTPVCWTDSRERA